MENIDIVLGCSFGDEGKGKVVYNLLKRNKYNLCVRFNGSGNAGHTIYENGVKFVVHQLPVGTLNQSIYNLISSDCLIDISRLKMEIKELEEKGINLKDRLFISKACHIITPECIEYDRENNKIGTTCSGIGPTYSQKMLRTGKRVEDFENLFDSLGIKIVNMREFWFSDFVKNNVKNILIEGAQGFELDINWTNNYPYCTSSTCTLAGAINVGIPIKKIRDIYGISKIYDTYVGTMKFQPNEYSEELEKIGEAGQEFGATTGRKRQCNFLNLNNLIQALKLNNCTICIINKADILINLNIFKLYFDNKVYSFEYWEDMKEFILEKLKPLHIEVIFSFNPYHI